MHSDFQIFLIISEPKVPIIRVSRPGISGGRGYRVGEFGFDPPPNRVGPAQEFFFCTTELIPDLKGQSAAQPLITSPILENI